MILNKMLLVGVTYFLYHTWDIMIWFRSGWSIGAIFTFHASCSLHLNGHHGLSLKARDFLGEGGRLSHDFLIGRKAISGQNTHRLLMGEEWQVRVAAEFNCRLFNNSCPSIRIESRSV